MRIRPLSLFAVNYTLDTTPLCPQGLFDQVQQADGEKRTSRLDARRGRGLDALSFDF